jgi:hypothetical protein
VSANGAGLRPINFNGNGEIECGNFTPSDQALAIGDGADPIVQADNLCVSVWSPIGTRLAEPIAMTTFFPCPNPILVGPTYTEGKVRGTRSKYLFKGALQNTAPGKPVMIVTKAVYTVSLSKISWCCLVSGILRS